MAAHECRVFGTFHAEIIDANDGAICVLGLGNSACLRFVPDSYEPARRY